MKISRKFALFLSICILYITINFKHYSVRSTYRTESSRVYRTYGRDYADDDNERLNRHFYRVRPDYSNRRRKRDLTVSLTKNVMLLLCMGLATGLSIATYFNTKRRTNNMYRILNNITHKLENPPPAGATPPSE